MRGGEVGILFVPVYGSVVSKGIIENNEGAGRGAAFTRARVGAAGLRGFLSQPLLGVKIWGQ